MKKRDTILVVDDVEMNRTILCTLFEKNYNLLEAENGEQALQLLEKHHRRIAIVLLDLNMPVMNGYEVLDEMRKQNMLSTVPVIVITVESSSENELKAFDLGAADIIMKPFELHVVERRVQNVIELNLHKLYQDELIEEQACKLRESQTIMVDALASIIESRSLETGQHVQRIRLFTKVLLEDISVHCPEYNIDERKVELISSAAAMHDIGKIAIPDSILNKPGKLTAEEFEIMKSHTVKGCEMLASLKRLGDKEYLHYAYNICRHHHERWDGGGYPDHLVGDAIPIYAQITGIADCYDALTMDRVYRKAIEPDKAAHMILTGECGTFSSKLLQRFQAVSDTFAQLALEYKDHADES